MNIISKIKDSILSIKDNNVSYAVLVLLALASIATSVPFALPVAMVCFTGLVAFDKWQDKNKVQAYNKEIEQQVSELKDFVSSVNMQKAMKATPTTPRTFFG